MKTLLTTHPAVKLFLYMGLIILCIGSWIYAAYQLPIGQDWRDSFLPASMSMFSGHTPYIGQSFFNPPWALLITFIPSLFSVKIGGVLFSLVGMLGYVIAIVRMKVDTKVRIFLLSSPMFIAALINPNFDWLILLGFTLVPVWGIFLVMIKPQIGLMLVVYWTIEAWRKERWHGVISLLAPVILLYLFTFVLYGFWPLHMLEATKGTTNSSLWPWSLFVGVPAMIYGVWKRKDRAALFASPFFSPYIAFLSWFPAMVALFKHPKLLFITWIGAWALTIFTILHNVP